MEEVSHNERASWLEGIEQELSTTEVQEDVYITVEDVRFGMNKIANWKAAGPDLVQEYWFIKKLTWMHPSLQMSQRGCSREGQFRYTRTWQRAAGREHKELACK